MGGTLIDAVQGTGGESKESYVANGKLGMT